MWPGEQQPGGQPDPQGAPADARSGGQQPGHGQAGAFGPPSGFGPPPGGQPPAFGQPTAAGPGQPPYPPPQAFGYEQQPPGFGQVPPQWQQPGPPTLPPQPPNRRRTTIGIAVAAAVVLIAAGVGVAMGLRDGGGDTTTNAASPTPSAAVSAAPSNAAPSAPPEAGPRGDGSNVQPVVPGWQAVVRADRKVAFDVPQGWTVKQQDVLIGFEDEKGNPAVGMGAPAIYKENYCGGNTNAAAAGTKGAEGAKSVQDAAENQAQAWAYYGFNDMKSKQKGTLKSTSATPFSNSHGINGYLASATETNVPKTNQCATDGAAYAIAWVGHNSQLTVFVLYTSTGVPSEVPSQTIKTIEGSIRQIP
ncbi:hypothetical protein [Streptomyces sp. RPT161]|uniref:hypothetical protein n=1 Tax=Streptomyces sp. RPT161 TaxID=3015993 RepID=UPI0022B8F4AF|nr:hypothetical protein [Streptomyces sp. RPT161]